MNKSVLPDLLSILLAVATATVPTKFAMGAPSVPRQTEATKTNWAEVLATPVKINKPIGTALDIAIVGNPAQLRAFRKGKGSLDTVESIVRLRGAMLDPALEIKVNVLLEKLKVEGLTLSMSETDIAMLRYYGRVSSTFPVDSYLESLPGILQETAIEFAKVGVDTIADAMSRSREYWSDRRQSIPRPLVDDLQRALAAAGYQLLATEAGRTGRLRGLDESIGQIGLSLKTVAALKTLRIEEVADLNQLNLSELKRAVTEEFDRGAIVALMKEKGIPIFEDARHRGEVFAMRWGATLPKNPSSPKVCRGYAVGKGSLLR